MAASLASALWDSEEVMSLNADLDLTMDQLVPLARAVLRIFSPAAPDVLNERCRQVEAEGWTPGHDDATNLPDELALAASCYCVADKNEPPPAIWPWPLESWKPKDRRRNMVRAAALLLAEIERLDRNKPANVF